MNLYTPVQVIFDSSSEDGRIIIFWGVVTVLLWVYLWVALTGHSELSKKKKTSQGGERGGCGGTKRRKKESSSGGAQFKPQP